jgi:hypothetical protein
MDIYVATWYRYRASNEGRFPSIKCVRQQIGGGHYTVREILQELEYNHANPPMDNAKAVQGATQVATHSRSTNESKAGQAQETAHFAGKNPDNLVALKNDQLDDVQHSLKDATAGTVTIEKVHPFVLISSECTADCHYFYLVFLEHFCWKTCMFPVTDRFILCAITLWFF